MSARPFEIVCEIEPPVRPDLTHARHQIGVLTTVSSTFLIPDNHIGRATVSSIAVAHEVQAMGGHSIACINSRDRNLLGFRRDLLTAAAYGVGQFLFVYGDKPGSGTRTSDLTVRSMIEEARSCTAWWMIMLTSWTTSASRAIFCRSAMSAPSSALASPSPSLTSWII